METKKFLDQEGLSFLWEKLSLQDYPNNDTLVAIIDAIDKNKADKKDDTPSFDISLFEQLMGGD